MDLYQMPFIMGECEPPQGPLAIVRIREQNWEPPFAPEEALRKGTIFPALNLPCVCCGGENHKKGN